MMLPSLLRFLTAFRDMHVAILNKSEKFANSIVWLEEIPSFMATSLRSVSIEDKVRPIKWDDAVRAMGTYTHEDIWFGKIWRPRNTMAGLLNSLLVKAVNKLYFSGEPTPALNIGALCGWFNQMFIAHDTTIRMCPQFEKAVSVNEGDSALPRRVEIRMKYGDAGSKYTNAKREMTFINREGRWSRHVVHLTKKQEASGRLRAYDSKLKSVSDRKDDMWK